MAINSGNVENALNDFRALMKPCFINSTSFNDTEVDIGSGIKIPPIIQAYVSDTNQITDNSLDVNLDIYDSTQIDKISQATYDKIQINDNSGVSTLINTYILYDKYTLQDIRNAVGSDSNVRSTHREYLSHLIYHYIQLIILSAIAINYTDENKNKNIYKSYKKYITYYISIVKDIDRTLIKKNYKSNKNKVSNSSSSFVEQKTYNKKIINEIEDNERHLDYLYLYIYFIITLLVVIILFCILFKNKNNYLISVLVVLILINAYFSKYVVLIEGFTTYKPDADIEVKAQEGKTSPTECSDHLNIQTVPKSEIKYKLCQALQVTYNKFENNSIDSTELIKENKLYNGLYNKAKNINLNTKDKINIDTFSFYRRKAYTNLFMRIVILGILLLILYNIFGYNYIIVILGIVLFCLILMVYFYTLKHMSRTNYRTKNWI